ncbi:hypothetical protein PSPO01_10071 [Paraphaeosphaeria sporulosa]
MLPCQHKNLDSSLACTVAARELNRESAASPAQARDGAGVALLASSVRFRSTVAVEPREAAGSLSASKTPAPCDPGSNLHSGPGRSFGSALGGGCSVERSVEVRPAHVLADAPPPSVQFTAQLDPRRSIACSDNPAGRVASSKDDTRQTPRLTSAVPARQASLRGLKAPPRRPGSNSRFRVQRDTVAPIGRRRQCFAPLSSPIAVLRCDILMSIQTEYLGMLQKCRVCLQLWQADGTRRPCLHPQKDRVVGWWGYRLGPWGVATSKRYPHPISTFDLMAKSYVRSATDPCNDGIPLGRVLRDRSSLHFHKGNTLDTKIYL